MALIPHKADPNYESQMEAYKKDNSRWGGEDMNKGMPPRPSPQQPAPPPATQSGKR